MTNTGVISIHGRDYKTVALRVTEFRRDHPDWCLTTEIVHIDDTVVVVKASVSDREMVVATGYSEEKRAASSINKLSALENSETSAIGRALAALGYGGSEYASAEEVAQVQEDLITESQVADLNALIEEVGADLKKFLKYLKVPTLDQLPAKAYPVAVKALEAKRRKQ